MKWIFFFMVLLPGFTVFGQTDYWAYEANFSGNPINRIPVGIGIPTNDQVCRQIINLIIEGNSYADLKSKFPDSLQLKLQQLISGGLIERQHNRFKLLFPVIVGQKRVNLQKVIHAGLTNPGISFDTILHSLKRVLNNKDSNMIFHFLWSRVLDDCWWQLYNQTFNTDKGPPSIALIVFPPHPFQCGTNSDYSTNNDMFARTWSYSSDQSLNIPSTKSFFDLSSNKTVSTNELKFFRQHELVDSAGRSLIFTYHDNDTIDVTCDRLKKIYIDKIKGLFNYSELSKTFQIPADELFIIMSHEIAYEIIGQFYYRKELRVPIFKKDNPNLSLKWLVSIRNAVQP